MVAHATNLPLVLNCDELRDPAEGHLIPGAVFWPDVRAEVEVGSEGRTPGHPGDPAAGPVGASVSLEGADRVVESEACWADPWVAPAVHTVVVPAADIAGAGLVADTGGVGEVLDDRVEADQLADTAADPWGDISPGIG